MRTLALADLKADACISAVRSAVGSTTALGTH